MKIFIQTILEIGKMYVYKNIRIVLSLGKRNNLPDAPFSLIVALVNHQIPYQK